MKTSCFLMKRRASETVSSRVHSSISILRMKSDIQSGSSIQTLNISKIDDWSYIKMYYLKFIIKFIQWGFGVLGSNSYITHVLSLTWFSVEVWQLHIWPWPQRFRTFKQSSWGFSRESPNSSLFQASDTVFCCQHFLVGTTWSAVKDSNKNFFWLSWLACT